MAQSNSELTVLFIWAVEWFISAINIWGVKCDKVVDFPKSGHMYCRSLENMQSR